MGNWDKQRKILLQIKKKITKTQFEDVLCPNDNDEKIKNFIWIGYRNKLIGNDNCHYEFIFQEDAPNILSLEVHLDEANNQELFKDIMLPDFIRFKIWNHRYGRIVFNSDCINIDDPKIVPKSLELLDKLHNSIGDQLIEVIESHTKLLTGYDLKPKLLSKSRKIVTKKKYKERFFKEATYSSRHGEIQNKLAKKLNKNKQYMKIIVEAGFENLDYQIDLLAQKENEHYDIFEVKPYATALICIREALGQILHYKYLLEKGKKYVVDDIYIVGVAELSEDEILYFAPIQEKFPIKYLNINNLNFKFSESTEV